MLRRAASLLPPSLRLVPQLQLQRGYAELVTGSDSKVGQAGAEEERGGGPHTACSGRAHACPRAPLQTRC